jgi:hypothetical protein
MDKQEIRKATSAAYDADKLARIAVDYITNDKGEILARVWENPGFREIYDYKGIELKRRRMARKQEQVFNQTDASK